MEMTVCRALMKAGKLTEEDVGGWFLGSLGSACEDDLWVGEVGREWD
jgi:hypothetical protein